MHDEKFSAIGGLMYGAVKYSYASKTVTYEISKIFIMITWYVNNARAFPCFA